MTNAAKSYTVEFGLSMLAYTIVLPLSLAYISHYPEAPLRFAIALAPVVPLLFALAALLRFLGRVDELQRCIQLDAFAFSAGATGLCTFAYAMLENVGAPRIGFEWVLPFIIVVWGLAAAVAARRYSR